MFCKSILSISLACVALPAFACDYCERRVTLTSELAQCYLDRVEQEIALMEQSALPAQLINLAICDSAQSATRGAGSLPTATATAPPPSLSFVLDAAGLRCLARDVAEETWQDTPIKTFEVTRDCE